MSIFESIQTPNESNLVRVCEQLKRNIDVLTGADSKNGLSRAFLVSDAKAADAAVVNERSTRSGTKEVSIAAPTKANQPYLIEKDASGTDLDFAVPTWANHLVLSYYAVSTNGTSTPYIRTGDATGIVTTGYSAGSSSGITTVTSTDSSTLFPIRNNVATASLSGCITFLANNRSRTKWAGSGVLYTSSGNRFIMVMGRSLLTSGLRTIRVGAGSSDSFDAGSFSLWVSP